MLRIVPYQSTHQNGIDQMMAAINAEFDESIYSKPKSKKPIIPDHYWVAIHGEEVAGTVAIVKMENNFAVLKKMMVKRAFRGKALGVSKLLLSTAIDWCRNNHIPKLYLGTMKQFKAAQAFYKKNGFEQISANELPKSFVKNPVDSVFFVLDLKKK